MAVLEQSHLIISAKMIQCQMETILSAGGTALLPGTERRPGAFTATVPRFFASELDPARPLRLVLLHALPPGKAVQVDPTMKPKLKPPGTKRLKLKCDVLPSNFAFKFNLRRYTPAPPPSTPCSPPSARRWQGPRQTTFV